MCQLAVPTGSANSSAFAGKAAVACKAAGHVYRARTGQGSQHGAFTQAGSALIVCTGRTTRISTKGALGSPAAPCGPPALARPLAQRFRCKARQQPSYNTDIPMLRVTSEMRDNFILPTPPTVPAPSKRKNPLPPLLWVIPLGQRRQRIAP